MFQSFFFISMTTLKNLDRVLCLFGGDKILLPSGKPLTFKKVILDHLGGFGSKQSQGTDGEGLIKAYNLGCKISDAKDSIKLTDEQVKFIRDSISGAPLYAAAVVGKILIDLDILLEEKKRIEEDCSFDEPTKK